MKRNLEVGDFVRHKYREIETKGFIAEIKPNGEVLVNRFGITDIKYTSTYFLDNLEIDNEFLIEERNKKIDKLCQEK